MRVAARVLRWIATGALLLLVVLGALAYLIIRTQPGHDLLLSAALAQAARLVDGNVAVGGLTSTGLLRGLTLHGLSISDASGRPFVSADSLRVRYSIADLLRRDVVLVPVEIWSPTVVIETLHGDSLSNVRRILGGGGEEPEAAPPFAVVLRQTDIHDGRVVVRLPLEESAVRGRGVYERLEGSGEGEYRLLQFDRIEARVIEADISGPEREDPFFRFEGLSFIGHVLEEPFTITEIRGDLSLEAENVRFDFDRLRMPGSEMSAAIDVGWAGPEGVQIEGTVAAEEFEFEDFRWLEPRLPDGGGRLDVRISGPLDRTTWRVVDADLEAGSSRILGDLGLDLVPEIRFAETDLELRPLDLVDLARWLPEPLPFEGAATGSVRLRGPLDNLVVSGDLTFEDANRGIPASKAVVDGTLHVLGGFGATELDVTLEPFRYETMRAFLPDLEFAGEGRARMNLTGELSSSVQVSGQVEHDAGNGRRSVVSVSGAVERSQEDLGLALALNLDPLSLDGIADGLGRALPITGEVSGSVRAVGPVSDLVLSSSLVTAGGVLDAVTRLDLRTPFSRYRVETTLDRYRLDELLPGLPDPTILTGEVLIDGAGVNPEDLSGTADLVIREARVGRAEVTGLDAHLRAQGGRLLVEELDLRSPVITLSGSGNLALQADQPGGQLSVNWAMDSLSELRPALLGGEVIAADTLTQLERDILRLDGIDPDTLGIVDQVALEGSARGELILRGWVRDLEGEGFAELYGAVFGENSVERSRADVRGVWRGIEDWAAEAVLDFDTLSAGQLRFARGSGGVSYASGGVGDFDLSMVGPREETYVTEGGLERDSLGTEIALRVLDIGFDGEAWALEAPTSVRLEGSRISSDGFRMIGPESSGNVSDSGASVEARGVLDLEMESDFALIVAAVDLDEMWRMAQAEGLPSGNMDLSVQIRGPASNPTLQGDILVRDIARNGTALSRLEGTLAYEHLSLEARLTGDLDGRRLFSLEGQVPVDLSLGEVGNRFPDREMDLTVVVDSFPAATALSFLDRLEEVQGSFDGQVRLQGTAQDLRPSGEIRLTGGALSIPEIGLRPRRLSANLRVREDFRVEVQAEAVAVGTARVTGTVDVTDPVNPEFDLVASTAGFQAVARRDLTARVGGQIRLTGPFNQPLVTGAVDVEQGDLFLEEFVRGAEVIDLTDPRFFDVVDTTIVSGPLVGAVQSPFLQNLRVDVALSLDQGFWIRSQESTQGMDLELGGNLAANFDRAARELRLVGNLVPIRGSYTQFGRLFDVQSGTIEFVGTPGINPSLSIQAIHRLRRDASEPLNVIANVGGTLQNPQVALSSDAQPPIPESDLISYLLFGRPSYALASGETSVVESAAAGLGGAVLSLGVSQLGSTFGRSLGVDYLSVSQAQQAGGLSSFRDPSGLFADTEIEMGRYVGDNVFISVVLRPLTGLDATRGTQLPGARLEWRFDQYWSVRGFLEDRLTRPGGSGFGELDNNFARVFGLSLFREWGY